MSKLPSRFQRRLLRLRHFRGHGVHSPYIYRIYREILMRWCDGVGAGELYRSIESIVGRRYAAELQQIYTYSNCVTVQVFVSSRDICDYQTDMIICCDGVDVNTIRDVVANSIRYGTTVAVISPYGNSERESVCRALILNHHSTTLDREGYLLFFNNHLPKQHLIL